MRSMKNNKSKLNSKISWQKISYQSGLLVPVWVQLKRNASTFQRFFNIIFYWEARFSAFWWIPCTIHRTHKPLFSTKFSLKISHAVLFTYLKIILLLYFQLSIFSKISGIQTKPNNHKDDKSLNIYNELNPPHLLLLCL